MHDESRAALCPAVPSLTRVSRVQSAAKGTDGSNKEVPLHIYGPPGIAEYMDTLLSCSDTFLAIVVIVHEFVKGPVSDEDAEPRLINWRSKLWKVRAGTPALGTWAPACAGRERHASAHVAS